MKKNDLIKLLQEIEGNPQVMIWNGFVEDVTHIYPPDVDYLIRLKAHIRKKYVEMEGKEYKGPDPWRYSSYLFEDLSSGDYEKKKIIILSARPAGKTTFDRMGKIEY